MTDERPRKRAWGKTKNRGKGPPLVDPLDSDMDTPEEPVKRIKINTFEEPNHHQTIDLQSPELMSDSVLVEVLSTFKVPIPVYSDGTPSRERLIYLFKKHVTPQPQRTRGSGRFWRKRISAQRSSTSRVIPLEMDIDSQQEWSDITDSDASTVNSTNKRKRKLEDGEWHPLKRLSPQIPYKSFSEISVSNSSTGPIAIEETLSATGTSGNTQARLLKLKRPATKIGDISMQPSNVNVTTSVISTTPTKGRITWP